MAGVLRLLAAATTTAGAGLGDCQGEAVGLQVAGTRCHVHADVAGGAGEGTARQRRGVGGIDVHPARGADRAAEAGVQIGHAQLDELAGAALTRVEAQAAHPRPVGVHRGVLDLVVQVDVAGAVATRMRQCAVPRIQVVIGHLVGIAGAAIGAGAVAQGQATDAAAHAHLYGVGVGLHEAGVADGVAGGDLVGADAGLGNGRGRHRGGQRVLLLVVVARRDVHADVARGTAEGIAAKRGRIGDASVLGDVAEPGLVDEHFGVGHAEAEGRIRRRQRCGVVLRVVVAGHHVEAEIARRACAYAVADRGTVGDQAVAGGVVADRLAVKLTSVLRRRSFSRFTSTP
ncbi:hypothetical protein G6F57_012827 [Rhizopus arrhizus]|nr:hypothetical protein G6F57_012827 [Rhizopus arrhizus]